MNLVWQNAWLAPALALIAVPVLVHLFARAKPPAYQFSSNEFIRRANKKTLRLKKPQDLILLLIRTLLFAALILLFLQPMLFSRFFSDGGDSRHVVLLVDASASMAYAEGGRTRFSAATAQASEVLGGLEAGDTANVIFLTRSPEGALPELSPNLGFLRERLRSAQLKPQSMSAAPALSAALAQLEAAPGTREVWVLSDFQATAWRDQKLEVPPDVRLVQVRIGQEEASNVGVLNLKTDPPVAFAGDEVTVSAEVANFSPEPRRVTAYLEAGESRASQPLNLEPWSRGVASFPARALPGEWEITVRVDEDALTGDNQRGVVLPVRDALRVGIVAEPEGAATAEIWARALRALGRSDVRRLEPDALGSQDDLDVLFLAGWRGDEAATRRLRELRERGLSIVWMPSPDGDAAALFEAEASGAPRRERLREPMRLRLDTNEDPVFALFADGQYGDPTRGEFSSRLKLTEGWVPARSTPLLAYADGQPALARLPNPAGAGAPGTLMLWNLDLDPAVSNWAGQPEFLFVLGELLESLAQQAVAEVIGPQPGDSLFWQPRTQVVPSEVSLQGPDGAAVELLEGGTGSGLLQSLPVAKTGVYEWQLRGESAKRQAVNFPAAESDLRTLTPTAAEGGDGVIVDGSVAIREFSEGTDLWPYLLLLGVALVIIEGGFLWWARRF
ncbi:MAG: BatA and WFA domain-containing protein [Verrucomicrobiota bacterium]